MCERLQCQDVALRVENSLVPGIRVYRAFAWAVRVMICRALAQHPENASDLC